MWFPGPCPSRPTREPHTAALDRACGQALWPRAPASQKPERLWLRAEAWGLWVSAAWEAWPLVSLSAGFRGLSGAGYPGYRPGLCEVPAESPGLAALTEAGHSPGQDRTREGGRGVPARWVLALPAWCPEAVPPVGSAHCCPSCCFCHSRVASSRGFTCTATGQHGLLSCSGCSSSTPQVGPSRGVCIALPLALQRWRCSPERDQLTGEESHASEGQAGHALHAP